MTRRANAVVLAPAAAALLLCACVELPEFERPSRVDEPRVLAVVAEPPEINPGQDVALSLLVAGAESYSVRWRACAAFDSNIGAGAQFGDEAQDEGCGASLAIELGSERSALLPGVVSAQLWGNLELAETVLGSNLPKGTVERVRESVGLPFLVEAEIESGDTRLRAIKRVLVSERADPNRNPPRPSFRLGEFTVSSDDADDGAGAGAACAPPDGAELRVDPDSDVELVPEVGGDGELEPWLERYQVLDLRGDLQEREETAFYSWFSTAGGLREEVTQSPLRNEIWHTPAEPGCYPLWLVVRDGHGGTSAGRAEVAVADADCGR